MRPQNPWKLAITTRAVLNSCAVDYICDTLRQSSRRAFVYMADHPCTTWAWDLTCQGLNFNLNHSSCGIREISPDKKQSSTILTQHFSLYSRNINYVRVLTSTGDLLSIMCILFIYTWKDLALNYLAK